MNSNCNCTRRKPSKSAAVGSRRYPPNVFWLLVFLLLTGWNACNGSAWDLGPYQLVNGPSSGPLRVKKSSASLASYGFVGSVGGVAFGETATLGPYLRTNQWGIVYNATNADGKRLCVLVGKMMLAQNVPDWILIPTAQYADSEYQACVSLFGENATKSAYDIVYHESFENTLLGVRLLQSDILLFDISEMWRLPTFNGLLVLGLGESKTGRLDANSAQQVSAALSKADFQSWVLTDEGENPIADLVKGKLHISGSPYYYFWASDFSRYEREVQSLSRCAQQFRSVGDITEHNRIVRQINGMQPQVYPVSDVTTALRSGSAVQKLNTPVSNAATLCMRYAAFFRCVKIRDPEAWRRFMSQISPVRVEPQVTTPTRWQKPL